MVQTIKSVWSSIADFSIKPADNDFSEKKRIRLINLMMFVVSLLQLLFVLVLVVLDVPFTKNFFLRIGVIWLLALVVYILHYFRQYTFARLLIIITLSFAMLNNVRSFKGAMSVEHYFFVIAASCFILFKRLSFIIASFIFVFIVYAFVIDYFGKTYPQAFFVNVPTYVREGMAFFTLFLLFNLFRNEHESYQAKIEQNNEEILAQKDNIEAKNKEIVASITYARRIQNALLPKKELIEKNIPSLLAYYLPKDIVSGDFYWFSNSNDLDSEVFLAVADCTGHGVPGAFMTVIGANILDQIINKDKIFSPAEILTELDKRLLKILQQQEVEIGKINDGMDIAILKLNLAHQKLTFAGAKRPIWIFENGKNEPTQYKGDKFPIGSGQFKTEKAFIEMEISLHKGDVIYAFTDGYTDQFGKQGKFTIRRFRNLLAEIYQKDFDEQEIILQKELQNWKGTIKQTDDVLLIGIKV